jgi:omega-6 fatty acid desaturase / acyl-lipid omega-6 desaturase (Delta-12 desaturase)
MFAPHHAWQVIVSDIGVLLWLAAVGFSIHTFGFATVFRTYLVPYLWLAAISLI